MSIEATDDDCAGGICVMYTSHCSPLCVVAHTSGFVLTVCAHV